MSRISTIRLSACWVLLGLIGCGDMSSQSPSVYREGLKTPSGEPAYITVQHCLIGFEGSIPGKTIVRTKAEAEKLAHELFEQAQAGEDFSKLVVSHTDDSAPGIYRLANIGFPGDTTSPVPSRQVYARNQMTHAFCDTGFALKVGEVGLAAYEANDGPYGWHIVKRLK